MYNIDDYTDDELHQLLGLNHPTDRELEAQIYQKMEQYKEHEEWYQFFVDVYERFFEVEEEEQTEGFEQPPVTTATAPATVTTATAPATITTATAPATITTSSVSYQKDKLNPLLKETIKRIISIDSQFRDNTLYPYPSSYTFNLSETLRDVVSMKLYSVQIPYTWYTISNNFGSNFFYIKGKSPGINNGNFDYQVSIQSGNYQSSDFLKFVNNSLQTNVFDQHSDINFGTTQVTYEAISAKMTMMIDISHIYNESRYTLSFPTPIEPSGSNIHDVISIPQLLGYQKASYQPNAVYSNPIAVAKRPDQDTTTRYSITTGTTFYVLIYQGPEPYSLTLDTSSNLPTNVIHSMPITLSLTTNNYLVSQIVDDINQQLQNNALLRTTSALSYIQSDPNSPTFRYQFTMDLQRSQYTKYMYVKTALYFPSTNIWASCFHIPNVLMELSNLVSETPSEITTYTLSASPQVRYQCITPYYRDSSNNNHRQQDISMSGVYTITQYVDTINASLAQLTTTESHSFHSSFVIDELTSIPTFRTNIHNTVGSFTIDLSGSILHKILGFPSTVTATYDTMSPYTSSFQLQQGYDIDTTSNLMVIYSTGINNNGVPPTPVTIPVTDRSIDTITLFETINQTFAKVTTATKVTLSNQVTLSTQVTNYNIDNSYNNIDMRGTYLTFTIDSRGTVTCNLQLNIHATLNESDYQLQLFDASSNTNSWNTNFFFTDTSYNMVYDASQNCAITTASTSVYSNQLTLTADNHHFYVTPVYDALGGVYTYDGDTTYQLLFTLTLPLGISYTKEQIVQNMNQILSANGQTRGSSVNISTSQTVIRLTVNKVFSAQDYQLVFFDTSSFTRCNFGVPITTTSDTTLGWILGFRNATQYNLSAQYVSNDTQLQTQYYGTFHNQPYSYDTTTLIAKLTGDTAINVNLYNYVMIILDDYTQNHLNDGLVTITSTDSDIPLPSYASRNLMHCQPLTQTSSKLVVDQTPRIGNGTTDTTTNNQLTLKQMYAANQILYNQANKELTKSSGPFVQDIFGLVPIKTSGLQPGQSYIEFGGTLQNQDRLYFGPVNLRRMTIQLLNDKGTLLDLNGTNWSFSLLVEQMYNPTRG